MNYIVLWKNLSVYNGHNHMELAGFLSQATISINIYNFLICFCSFALSCSILEKENVIKICLLYCLVLLNSILFFNLVCFDLNCSVTGSYIKTSPVTCGCSSEKNTQD